MSHLFGKAWKFGDNITTDYIAPGRYFHLRSNLEEFSKHVLKDANPEFAGKVQKGDFVVAGKNFGMGSSREHAPAIIKIAGVSAVLAGSFSRIFFRNAINIGLPVIIMDTSFIDQGDEIRVSLGEGIVTNVTKSISKSFKPLPQVMLNILNDGGLIKHVAKNKDLVLK
ncbi:MAG TPA: 3-isopropylmalate dehydratase small subunit [Clostridia bacterium]|nr:3-isopropylmalate dehydratase small subunit [Clostridia bacterium]